MLKRFRKDPKGKDQAEAEAGPDSSKNRNEKEKPSDTSPSFEAKADSNGLDAGKGDKAGAAGEANVSTNSSPSADLPRSADTAQSVDLDMDIGMWDESADHMTRTVLPGLSKHASKMLKLVEKLQSVPHWTAYATGPRSAVARLYEDAQTLPRKSKGKDDESSSTNGMEDIPVFVMEHVQALHAANEHDKFATNELIERQQSDTVTALRRLQEDIRRCTTCLKRRKDVHSAAKKAQLSLRKETDKLERDQAAAANGQGPVPSPDKRMAAETELREALQELVRVDEEAEHVSAPIRSIHENRVDSVVGDALRLAFDHQRMTMQLLLSSSESLVKMSHPKTTSHVVANPPDTASKTSDEAFSDKTDRDADGPSLAEVAAASADPPAATPLSTTSAPKPAFDSDLDASPKPAVFEGALMKKGDKRRNWKRRWFVLEDGAMAYHAKDSRDSKKIGSFDVRGMSVSAVAGLDKHQFVVQVATPIRAWYLEMSSQSDLERWRENLIAHGANWTNVEPAAVEAAAAEESGSDSASDDDDISPLDAASTALFKACIESLRKHPDEAGIFRESGSDVRVGEIVAMAASGQKPKAIRARVASEADPHTVANTLKRHLRTRPQGALLTQPLLSAIRAALSGPDGLVLKAEQRVAPDVVERVRAAIAASEDDPLLLLLPEFFALLHEIHQNALVGLMDASNLQVCLTPSIVESNAMKDAVVLGALIEDQPSFFPLS